MKIEDLEDLDSIEGDRADYRGVCEKTKGKLTIDSGWWHKIGEQYDLCIIEFDKLSGEEKAKYVEIKERKNLGADLDKYLNDRRGAHPTSLSATIPLGDPNLTKHDESTICPGLFLCGLQVRQDDQIFCFVYKYSKKR